MAFPCLEHFNGFPLPGIKESSLRSVSLLTSPDLPYLNRHFSQMLLSLNPCSVLDPWTPSPGLSYGLPCVLPLTRQQLPYMHSELNGSPSSLSKESMLLPSCIFIFPSKWCSSVTSLLLGMLSTFIVSMEISHLLSLLQWNPHYLVPSFMLYIDGICIYVIGSIVQS